MTIAQVDLEVLHNLVIHEPLAAAGREFGDSGSERMKGILRFLKKFARYSTVHEESSLTVFALMQPNDAVTQRRLIEARQFQFGVTARGSTSTLVIEIRDDGSPFVWPAISAEINAIVDTGIIYHLEQGVETFSINGRSMPVPKVIPNAISQFVLHCFTDLKEALIAYRDSMARTSKCHLLREAWAEDNRLWFVPKPEFRLRRALHNHLSSYLRHDEIDLREEQNVDASHPVDIKIVWRMENRSALIEVKWLGKSFNPAQHKITQSYTGVRAREGARQLAEYLEWHRQQAAQEDTRGYLVVFDCRRKGLNASRTTVERTNGFYYDNREITYDPEFHKIRKDFEEPVRIFLEPVCI